MLHVDSIKRKIQQSRESSVKWKGSANEILSLKPIKTKHVKEMTGSKYGKFVPYLKDIQQSQDTNKN